MRTGLPSGGAQRERDGDVFDGRGGAGGRGEEVGRVDLARTGLSAARGLWMLSRVGARKRARTWAARTIPVISGDSFDAKCSSLRYRRPFSYRTRSQGRRELRSIPSVEVAGRQY